MILRTVKDDLHDIGRNIVRLTGFSQKYRKNGE